jgi:putative hydrolase of the HAD superfamily
MPDVSDPKKEVTAIFWDVGGVILSNGWDGPARAAAVRRFAIDADDFEDRHDGLAEALETARITFDAYLDRAVFYRARPFTKEEFISFIFAQSTENKATREVLDDLTANERYLLGTINNESAELNTYRIRTFDLARNFTVFLSSCYLGVRKPGEAIYRLSLEITQRAPEECIFVDDRPGNLEVPARIGMRAIQFKDAAQLRSELASHGVLVTAG